MIKAKIIHLYQLHYTQNTQAKKVRKKMKIVKRKTVL